VSPVLAQVVDVGKLLETIEAAAIAGLGISLAFSLVIYGFAKAGEHRAGSRPVAATAHVVLGFIALAACGVGLAFGLSTMLAK